MAIRRTGCSPGAGYLETVPAAQFLDGLGIGLNTHRGEDANQILRMCAKNGIRQVRIEIGWASLNYDDETKLNNAQDIATRLLACKANGIRPLILLNGNSGAPCPLKFFSRQVTAPVGDGAREMTLDKTDDLIVGHSGINDPKEYWAAGLLVTKIEGNKVTLSRPWKGTLAAGAKVAMATLKYGPFGDPATDAGKESREGWKRYARKCGQLCFRDPGHAGATGSRLRPGDLERDVVRFLFH